MRRLVAATFMLLSCCMVHCAAETVTLSGNDHRGFLSASGFKNWGTEAEALAGLPDYAYAEIAPGLWTSIVAEPLSASSVYAEENSVSVQNKVVTDSDFATRSSGTIEYDATLLSGTGSEMIGASDLNVLIDAAAFSPLNSTHNAGSGFGNAGWDYMISISNLGGAGLAFNEGSLISIDLTADVSVLPRFGGNPALAFDRTFDGTLTFSGDQFAFDVDVTQDVGTPFGMFTDARLVFNRSGTIATVSAIPEPGIVLPLSLAAVCGLGRRRRRVLHSRRSAILSQ
ncbi:MAG: PEP-CTERM sorting domain-containing protein [Planctomycetota bacterium]